MSYSIPNTIKTYTLAALAALFLGLPWVTVHPAFAEIAMDSDIMMTIDTSEKFDDEAQMFNNFLNVFTAAYIATDGNMEVVVLDRNTICISARIGSCSNMVAPQNHHVAIEVTSKKTQAKILTAYD